MKHELKILPEYFLAIYQGKKHFEIRKDDRGFKVGHMLLLREWNGETGYSGHAITAEVKYILPGGFGLEPGFVCMSIRVMSLD